MMERRLGQVLAMCSALVSATASAETLAEYVNNCKADMVIGTALPALNCNNGVRFAASRGGGDPTNDFLGYSRITDAVDIAVACRWLGSVTSQNSFATAASVEMLLHNRQTGHTCFFAAKNPLHSNTGVSTAIVPPDDTVNADNYWMQPVDLDSAISPDGDALGRLRCVECHAAGPYIASPRIAPFLARFGLLNNGHDTHVDMNPNDMLPGPHYSALGSGPATEPTNPSNPSVFKAWNSIILAQFKDVDGNLRPDNECSTACHAIGLLSTNRLLSLNNRMLIPPLSADIAAVLNIATQVPFGQVGQVIQQIMPPDTYSDYRWVNMDTPTNGDNSEIETFQRLQQQYPSFVCPSGMPPSFLQARVVGSDVIYDTSGYQDKLRTFNVKDGLTCFSADQTNSHACLDYQTRYRCPQGTNSWTNWLNVTTGQANDNESRTNGIVGAAILSACGFQASPVGIQARFTRPGTTNVIVFDGPPDRLAQFDNLGLRCNNADQNLVNTCSNYVVRFVCPNTASTVLTTLRTDHNDEDTKQTFLTESTSIVNQGINNQYLRSINLGQAQQWYVEPVTNFSNPLFWTIPVSDRSRAVRFRNRWTNFYATSNNVNRGPSPQNPFFFLLAQALQAAWETQVWIKEPIASPNETTVRLRVAWIPPASASTVSPLYMTLTTARNGDTGTQDVYIKPSATNAQGVPDDVQRWQFLGVDGVF